MWAADIVTEQPDLIMVSEEVSALSSIKCWWCGVVQQHVDALGQARVQGKVDRHVPVALAGQAQDLCGRCRGKVSKGGKAISTEDGWVSPTNLV